MDELSQRQIDARFIEIAYYYFEDLAMSVADFGMRSIERMQTKFFPEECE